MTPQYIAQIVSNIIPALQPVVAEIEAQTRTSPAEAAAVTTAMTDLETLVASLATMPTVAATATALQQVQAYAQTILSAGSSMGLPYPASMWLQIGGMVVMGALGVWQTILAAQAPAPTPAAAPKAKR